MYCCAVGWDPKNIHRMVVSDLNSPGPLPGSKAAPAFTQMEADAFEAAGSWQSITGVPESSTIYLQEEG